MEDKPLAYLTSLSLSVLRAYERESGPSFVEDLCASCRCSVLRLGKVPDGLWMYVPFTEFLSLNVTSVL